EAQVPSPPPGHTWKEVRHDNTVSWLARWSENILGSIKSIVLDRSSDLKDNKDWQKYETARKLKDHVNRIRDEYIRDFKTKDMLIRQRAVAVYFIDKLALRTGNEKDEDADTVDCCSLRVKHISLHEENDGKRYVPSILNKYLNDHMEGLTAPVFRAYNESKTLQEQLDIYTKKNMIVPEKILAYNRANRAVGILRNHQQSVLQDISGSMDNLKSKINAKVAQINKMEKEVKTEIESGKQCKRCDVPIEKIYNKSQRDKFRWAIEIAGPDYVF
ncbi:DNA topoisomerase 1, partial [Caerostris extrusa]